MFKGVSFHHGHVFAVNVIVGVLSIGLALIVIAFDTLAVNASGDAIVEFSGRVMDEEGAPVTAPSLQMVFRLYDSGSNGQCIWSNSSSTCATATPRTVFLTNGVFSETLGDTARGYASMEEVALNNSEAYIGLVIEGQPVRVGVNGDIYITLPDQSIEEEPVVEEPVIEEPVIEEPVVEEPVVDDPGSIETPPVTEPGQSNGDGGSSDSGTPTTSTGGNASAIITITPRVEAGGKELPGGGVYRLIEGLPVELVLALSGPASSVRVVQNGTELAVRKESDRIYRARLATSAGAVTATVVSAGGKSAETKLQVEAVGAGLIREVVGTETRPAVGATATLYEGNLPWVALYGQSNPIIVGSAGSVGWLVENGSYRVEISKDGFLNESQTFAVTNGVVAPSVILNEDPLALVEPDAPMETELPTGFSASATEAIARVRESIDEFRSLPDVQIVGDVAVPVAVASAVGGTTSLATSFNLLPYLQYLFTSPILYIARRRRRPFGRVYNGYTKVPISLATIQLLKDGKIVKTAVTDEEGRFFLRAEPGEYTLQVKKPTFTFPSSFVTSTTDGEYLDIYRGETLRVTEENIFVAPNIPVDHIEANAISIERKQRVKHVFRILQRFVAVLGVLLALFGLVVNQNIASLLVFGLQFVVLVVTLILSRPKRLKGWATVTDGATKAPIANAVVRLFEPTYNKLLETTVTDRFGRYAFVVGPNSYYLTASAPGYAEGSIRSIDRSVMKQVDTLAVDIALQQSVST